MVLNAAWPLLANAKPVVPALPSEICSASGAKHGSPADFPDKQAQPSHCTLCPFNAERGAAIPPAVQPLLASSPAAAPTFARSDAPLPAISLHPAAPPRGPPLPS
jgi:DUF2946 family protein